MKVSQILILSVLALCCIQATVGAKRTANEFKEQIKTSIKASLPHLKENRNVRNVYFLFKAAAALKQDVAKLATELQLCASLNKVSLTDLPEGESQIFLVDLSRLAKCGHKDEKAAKDLVAKYTKSNLVHEYIAATLLGLDANLVTKNDAACTRAVEFFAADGTSLIDHNDKGGKTLYYTPFLVEIVERCGTKPGILQSAVKALLVNTYPIYKNGLSLVEGDSVFVATAHLVNGIVTSDSLKSLKEYQDKANALAFFLQAHAQYIEDGEDLYAYARVSDKIKATFFQLDTAAFDLSKKANWELSGSLYDIHFQPAKGSNVTLTGTVGKTKEKVTFTAKKDSYTAKFGSSINEPGYYPVTVELTSGGQKSTFDFTILIRKKIQVDSVRFDVATSNKRPTELANEVKGGKSFGEVLKSNQNGFVFVSFKVAGIESPAEVVLRLVHPQFLDATGTIPAKLNKDTYHYEAVLDLGNPDVILPYNGEYKLNLTVADLFGENVVQWTLGSFQLAFTKNQQGNPPSDSDYKLLPEIKHVFPEERKKPNPLITFAFVGLVLVALAAFFYNLSVLKVNFGRYPSSGLGPIFAFLFVLNLLALLGILTWFFIEINLFQTLGLLAIALIPTVVIGNLTFNSLETHDDASPDVLKSTGHHATEEEHKKDDEPKEKKPKSTGEKKPKSAEAKKTKKPKDE